MSDQSQPAREAPATSRTPSGDGQPAREAPATSRTPSGGGEPAGGDGQPAREAPATSRTPSGGGDERGQEIGLLEAISTTRAIRRFRPDPIPEADLATIMFAASRAPSGSNRQLFRFVLLRDDARSKAAKALLGTAARQAWGSKRAQDRYDQGSGVDRSSPKARMAGAMQQFVEHHEDIPVFVLPCLIRHRQANPGEGASIYPACQNLLLAARALGYGGVITMWHQLVEAELRTLLAIPEGVAMSASIPLGRPMGGHGPVRRRPLAEVVYDGGWEVPAPWAVDPPGTRFAQAGPPRS